jgi:hypothetical protein
MSLRNLARSGDFTTVFIRGERSSPDRFAKISFGGGCTSRGQTLRWGIHSLIACQGGSIGSMVLIVWISWLSFQTRDFKT